MPRSVILGRRPDGQIGIFVAKPGYDAAGADADLWFSMGDPQGQVVAAGEVELDGSGATGTTVWYPRTLAQRPFVYVAQRFIDPPALRVRVDVKLDRFVAFYQPRGGSSGNFYVSYLVATTKGYY